MTKNNIGKIKLITYVYAMIITLSHSKSLGAIANIQMEWY